MSEQLTRDRILAMPAGPEMDRLVSERVMGIMPRAVREAGGTARVTMWTDNPFFQDGCMRVEDLLRYAQPPAYSTETAVAWKVVDAVSAKGRGLVLEDCRPDEDALSPWLAYFFLPGGHTSASVTADTAPLAICRLALLDALDSAPLTPPTDPHP